MCSQRHPMGVPRYGCLAHLRLHRLQSHLFLFQFVFLTPDLAVNIPQLHLGSADMRRAHSTGYPGPGAALMVMIMTIMHPVRL